MEQSGAGAAVPKCKALWLLSVRAAALHSLHSLTQHNSMHGGGAEVRIWTVDELEDQTAQAALLHRVLPPWCMCLGAQWPAIRRCPRMRTPHPNFRRPKMWVTVA